eukprot:5420100-Prymnesium_polylepis.2
MADAEAWRPLVPQVGHATREELAFAALSPVSLPVHSRGPWGPTQKSSDMPKFFAMTRTSSTSWTLNYWCRDVAFVQEDVSRPSYDWGVPAVVPPYNLWRIAIMARDPIAYLAERIPLPSDDVMTVGFARAAPLTIDFVRNANLTDGLAAMARALLRRGGHRSRWPD